MQHKSNFFHELMASAAAIMFSGYAKHQLLKGFGTVSKTQRIALDAGTARHEKEFFKGIPDWKKLDDLPLPKLSEGAQRLLDEPARKLADLVDDWEIRNSDRQDLTPEAWQFLKDNKFFGLVIPEEKGGLGLSAYDHAEIVARIGTHCLAAALTTMVPNSLGPGELIERYGTAEQKSHYLARLADGREVPFFGLTEPFAGSDAFSIRTAGVVYKDEKTSEPRIRINGEKRYITLSAEVGTIGGFAVQLKDPDNLLGKGTDPGITCVLVPRGTPGLNIGNRHRPLDIPFQNGPMFLDNVDIPASDIIGGPAMAGEGARMLMECLGIGRSISLPATSAAAGRRTAFAAGAYATIRKQFGFSLADMKGQHRDLAQIAGYTYMIEAARTAMALRIDNGETPAIGSAVLKVQATEAMSKIVESGMRIQGGKAIMQGPRNFMGMMPQGEYVARTVEGDNNMTESVVIFGQGSKKGHEFLTDEIEAAQNGDNAMFKKLFRAHTKDILDNRAAARRMGQSGQGGETPEFATDETARYFRQMNRLSAAFNLAANVSMATLSGNLQVEQPTSRRLGKVYANMMMANYTLWYFHKVQKSDPHFLPLAKWVVETKLQEAEEALDDMIRNFPLQEALKLKLMGITATISNERIKSFLRANIFPRGPLYSKPSDAVESAAAATITGPGPVRDWLKSGMLVSQDPANAINHIGKAFEFITGVEKPVLDKLAAAMDRKEFKKLTSRDPEQFIVAVEKLGLLTRGEIDVLKKAEQYRAEVVAVDYYAPGDMRKGIPANPPGVPAPRVG